MLKFMLLLAGKKSFLYHKKIILKISLKKKQKCMLKDLNSF